MAANDLPNKEHNFKKLVEQIDAILPQTHCGQCGFTGCFPYAQAIAKKTAEIDRCPPGGVKTLKALANLLNKEAEPFLAKILKQEKPPMVAVIQESKCIGCTKCIQACPVDAILGAAKQLHVVLTKECTGCGLCLAPCPVDCIDMLVLNLPTYQPEQARRRFHARKQRLEKSSIQIAPTEQVQLSSNQQVAYIQAATIRAKAKKRHSQWENMPITPKDVNMS